jgi:hypothetical protein
MFNFVIEADSLEALRATIWNATVRFGAGTAEEAWKLARERMEPHGVALPHVPLSTEEGDPDFEAYCDWCDAVGPGLKEIGLWRAEALERSGAREAAEEELEPA